MKLQTTMPLGEAGQKMDYAGMTLLLGSCFVEHMGGKLDHFKFRTLQNPFGVLFHPPAIENLLQRAVKGRAYQGDELFEHRGVWSCFDAHSQLADAKPDLLLDRLNQGLEATREALEQASHLIISLGTAWVYGLVESGKIVANCHKLPQRTFAKRLLSIGEIATSLEGILDLAAEVRPGIHPIFTLSPVRHLKDGFVENQRSKAHLTAALHQVLDGGRGSYFPSYELMMDELRDYRFYARDLVHPNDLAIDYIWERFRSAWISPHCSELMQEVDQVQKGLGHRALQPGSPEHREFTASLREKITYLQGAYPFMKFD